MFDADSPIQRSTEDRLGRAIFTQYLARAVIDHQQADSLVVGLNGVWGTGKTSVMNLMQEELGLAANNMLDNEKPLVLTFNPWNYPSHGDLVSRFFQHFLAEMKSARYFEIAAQAVPLLERYNACLMQQINMPRNNKARIFKREVNEPAPDLMRIKAEINAILAAQKHKIIIFVDDVARIRDDEINQVFQIIKAIADFANTVYVIAMDKEQVIPAMNRIHGKEGGAYLEKVVQLQFQIPSISKQELEGILFDRLEAILKQVPEGAWDNAYWADIYYSSLRYFFTHCRDITRYVNKLNFWYARIKDLVNPVDCFALMVVSVFEPDVFHGIRENKDLFTDLIDDVLLLDQEKLAEDKSRCEEVLNRAKVTARDVLLPLLIQLFPRLRSMYQANTLYYHSASLARKNRRICDPGSFDVYFRFAPTSCCITDGEMATILALAHDEEGFSLALLRLNKDDRMLRFLNLLDGAILRHIATKDVAHVVNALIDDGDLFPEGESTPLYFNTPMRIHRIIQTLLKRFNTPEQRFAILRDAIKKSTKSLYIAVHELMVQSQTHSEDEDTFVPSAYRDITAEQLYALQQTAVEKIKEWARIGRLAEHPKLISILYAWKAWGSADECRNFVGAMVRTDKEFVAFLCAVLAEPINQTMTKLEKSPAWKKHLDTIEDFISVNILAPHAKTLFEDIHFEKLREREQLALLIFLDLINADTVKTIPKTTV